MKEKELAKFRGCTGLPTNYEAWKKAIPYRPGEIDYELPAVRMIRLTPETADYAYSDYSPTSPHYEPGTHPKLEQVVKVAVGNASTDRDKAIRLLDWTWRKCIWPHGIHREVRAVGGAEEDILDRGYCNELSRVFVTLCQVAGVAARITFHWTADSRAGHSCAEAWLDGKWVLCDSDINVTGLSVPGFQADCWELMQDAKVQQAFDALVNRQMLSVIGHPDPQGRYSDFFKVVGICNYPVEGFPYKVRIASSTGVYV